MALVVPLLPVATADRMPASRADATAVASRSVGHGLVNAPPPRLRFIAAMLKVLLLAMTKLMADVMAIELDCVPASNTSSARICAPGAVAATMPETLVP